MAVDHIGPERQILSDGDTPVMLNGHGIATTADNL